MKFSVTGVSGVGKSFLAEQLLKQHNFYIPPKYTDRPLRPTEVGGVETVRIPLSEFTHHPEQFFFTLEYVGNHYGWRYSDLDAHADQHSIIGITIEATERLIKERDDFIPIFLGIDEDHLDLMRKRMEARENYANLEGEAKQKVKEKIDLRMKLDREELATSKNCIELVKKSGGGYFEIKDDTTIFTEVIPFVLEKCKNTKP